MPGTIYTAAKEVEEAGGKALPLCVDIRDADAVKAAVDETASVSSAGCGNVNSVLVCGGIVAVLTDCLLLWSCVVFVSPLSALWRDQHMYVRCYAATLLHTCAHLASA